MSIVSGLRAIGSLVLSMQLVACGSVLDALPGAGGSKSGGGGSNDFVPDIPIGTISGVAKDALVQGGTVNVYAWDGAKGELLGAGTTDDLGRYSLELQVRSQSLLLEVTGGSYREEATGRIVDLDSSDAFFAVQNYTRGQTLDIAITYYTTLATGLAENLVRLGMKPLDAVAEANRRLNDIIGVDTIQVMPVDITNPDKTAAASLQYGFATAAVSSLTERASIMNGTAPHATFTSIEFIKTAYDDVRADGVLDGNGLLGEVAFGSLRLNADVYRHELALHILRIANNTTANKAGLGPLQVFNLAQRLNNSTDSIFGGAPVIPLDRDKPNVSALVAQEFPNLANNSVIFGGVNLTAMVMAFPGAASAELILDEDRVIGTAIDPENPVVFFDTFNAPIAEGRHTLKLRVTDISQAVGESPLLTVNVSNKQTAIENIRARGQPLEGQFVGNNVMVMADIADPAGVSRVQYSVRAGGGVFVPVASIAPQEIPSMFPAVAPFNPSPPEGMKFPGGDATFKIDVTNSVGFTFSSREVPFTIDLDAPSVSIADPVMLDTSPNDIQGRYFDRVEGTTPCMPVKPRNPDDRCLLYVRRSFNLNTEVTDNHAIGSVALTVGGVPVGQTVALPDIRTNLTSTFSIDPRSTGPDSEKVITITAADKAHNTATASQTVIVDTTIPAVDVEIVRVNDDSRSNVLPGTPLIVGGPVSVLAQVEDMFGIASTQVLINGVPVTSASPVFAPGTQGTRATLELLKYDTSNLPEGDNEFSVQATDRAGNSFSRRVLVDVDNAGPEINLTALVYPRDGACQLEVSFFDRRLSAVGFKIDSAQNDVGTGIVADIAAQIPPDIRRPGTIADTPVENSDTFSSALTLGGFGGNSRSDLDGRTSGGFTLEARDRFGNVTTRQFTFETPQRMSCTLREGGEILLTTPRQR